MQLFLEQAVKAVLSVILSGFIGLERETKHKPAGLRTHMLVGLGATVLTIVATDYFMAESLRVIAAIITGIGFIGAGTIIAQGSKGVHGLTTAASLWIAAAIGICVGIGWIPFATFVTVLIILVLFLAKLEHLK